MDERAGRGSAWDAQSKWCARSASSPRALPEITFDHSGQDESELCVLQIHGSNIETVLVTISEQKEGSGELWAKAIEKRIKERERTNRSEFIKQRKDKKVQTSTEEQAITKT